MKKMLNSPYWDKGKFRRVIMRLTMLKMVLIMGLLNSYAVGFSQTRISKLNLEKTELSEALKKIERLSDYTFIFNYNDILGHKVSADIVDMHIDDCMKKILEGKPFIYKIDNDIIIVSYKKLPPQQKKQITIKGKVLDKKGNTLPGVSVIVKGTQRGVSTDIDGNFTLTTEERSGIVLVCSFVGMKTKEVKYIKNKTLKVVLEEDSEQLEEIVITGYTQQKKETYTGASVSVKEETLQKANIEVSFLKTLQGQAPGVLVMDQVGSPDSEPKITVRGTGSISAGSEPLIIMDGIVITNPNIINVADIQSVTVQKDATATAIYGSRGSNGVILITTKKGKPGKPSITYDFKQGFGFAEQDDIAMMNSKQKLDYELALGIKSQEEADALLANGYNTNWHDELYKTSKMQVHNLSLSGGTEASRYSMSMQYHDEETVYGSEYKKYTGRLNLDSKLSDKLTVGVNLMFSRSDHEDKRIGYFAENAFLYNPYENGRDADGNLTPLVSGEKSVLYQLENRTENSQRNSFNTVVYGSYNILEDLVFRTQWGFSYDSSDSDDFTDPKLSPSWMDAGEKGEMSNNFSRSQAVTGTQTLNYAKTFDGVHAFRAMLGMEFNESKGKSFYAVGNGYSSGLVHTLDAAANPKHIGGDQSHSGMLSYFSQFSYAYNDKYFTDLSIRRDGSSKFGKNNQYATFWSIGGGWNIHKEDFMKGNIFDRLKLKGSIGTSGNASIGNFQAKLLYASDGNYAGTPAIYPDRLDNPNLTWEKNLNMGFGIDYALLASRLHGSIDFYNRKTTDLLLGINPLGTSGFGGTQGASNYMENVGEMVNKGVDISLNYDVLRGGDFDWSVKLNVSYNKNEVLKLHEGQDKSFTYFIYRENESANSLYLAKWAGVDPQTGMNQYYDENGEKTFDSSKKFVVAQTDPKIYGGFISDMSYKGFELYALISFTEGRYSLNSALYDLYNNPRMNQAAAVLDAWKNEGDIATISKRTDSYSGKDARYTTQFMENSSFIRLKNLNIAYNLPSKWLKKLNISRAKVYVQGQNLLTWSDLSVGNPESAGTSLGFSPNVRRYVFGINVNF